MPSLTTNQGLKCARIAMPAEAVARGIAYTIEQPNDVDVGSIVIRPTAQD